MAKSQQQTKARRKRKQRAASKKKPLPGIPLEVGERMFYLKPPGRSDIRRMEQWILDHRESPLDIAKRKLEGLTESQQRNLLRDALAQESAIPDSIPDQQFAEAIDTRDGAAMMLWLMLRTNHPDVALDEVDGMIEQMSDDEFVRFLEQRDERLDGKVTN